MLFFFIVTWEIIFYIWDQIKISKKIKNKIILAHNIEENTNYTHN